MGYIDGSESKPEDDDKKISAWKTKDAKIKTWLLCSIDPHFINLKPCKFSREMWDYLKKIYQQGNAPRQFQLELTQGTLSIQDYYNGYQSM